MRDISSSDKCAGKLDGHVKRSSTLRSVFGFLRWWLGFSALYAMFAVCPFCGRAGCPVGAGSAGFVGAFFAMCITGGKRVRGFVKGCFGGKTR